MLYYDRWALEAQIEGTQDKMQITQLKVTVGITRSKDYQSVRVEGEATIALEPEDDKRVAVDKARKWLSAILAPAADEELNKIIYGEGGV